MGSGPRGRVWLRQATAGAHARAEASLGLLDPELTAEAYADALAALHGLHAGLEPQLSMAVGQGWIAPALVGPAREGDLRHDLAALDREPPAAPRATRLDGPGDALAAAYVLGGSTLGATVLIRRVPPAVSSGARRYLEGGASPQARACWRGVSREIERCSPARLREVAATAVAIFDALVAQTEATAVRS
jgi:heme oxygenase